MACGAGPSDIAQVGQHGEQPENGAQDVLPLHDPGDRLDVKRMDGEQRRDEGAPQQAPRHRGQHLEEEKGVREVQQ